MSRSAATQTCLRSRLAPSVLAKKAGGLFPTAPPSDQGRPPRPPPRSRAPTTRLHHRPLARHDLGRAVAAGGGAGQAAPSTRPSSSVNSRQLESAATGPIRSPIRCTALKSTRGKSSSSARCRGTGPGRHPRSATRRGRCCPRPAAPATPARRGPTRARARPAAGRPWRRAAAPAPAGGSATGWSVRKSSLPLKVAL